MPSLAQLRAELARGGASRDLVEHCLARIDDPSGEGSRVFLKVHAAAALAAADYYDRMRACGAAPSPFAGIPVSIKDLFDVAGDVTTAGSTVLRDAAPAARDAPCVARLRAAGFIPIGRTNMTEFAFSGLGINPHYGTPRNPHDRAAARIPGGSSSGAAVSVTDGMAFGALGTDTGGSCRIPAALCGIVGFKPTAHRVPTEGAFPLSSSLNSVGPLAATVACCAVLDAVLAGEPAADLPAFPLDGLRLAVPQTMVLDGVEPAVAHAFDAALTALRKAGARIVDIPLRELAELAQINAKGGLSAAQSYAIHRSLIAKGEKMYDPRVLVRILRGTRAGCRRLHRSGQRAGGFHPPRCGRHRALRRAGDADRAVDGAADRRSRGRRRLPSCQLSRAAQPVDREFPRSLLDLDTVPPRRRRAGRAHADRRARHRSSPAIDRGRDRGGRVAGFSAGWRLTRISID